MELKSQIYTITKISYLPNNKTGTAQLLGPVLHSNSSLYLIWSIKEYPMETLGMPGSPFSVEVWYTIFDKKKDCLIKSNYNSLSGNFIYQINSGTLPKYSQMGIPYGTYISNKFRFILNESSYKLIII